MSLTDEVKGPEGKGGDWQKGKEEDGGGGRAGE